MKALCQVGGGVMWLMVAAVVSVTHWEAANVVLAVGGRAPGMGWELGKMRAMARGCPWGLMGFGARSGSLVRGIFNLSFYLRKYSNITDCITHRPRSGAGLGWYFWPSQEGGGGGRLSASRGK